MKDELQDLVMDESARKTATDWLMQVISGKKSNGNGNGAEHNGNGHSEELISSGAAVALAEMPHNGMPRDLEMSHNGMSSEDQPAEARQEFTAEDLCGAPAVPVIRAAPKNDITADDVCWVPEEMRLKPQVAEPPPSAKVHVMPSPEPREELDIRRASPSRDPELSYLTGTARPEVTAADISRDPSPHVAEATRSGADAGPEAREITAADIMRDSVRSYTPAPSGSDMPTSFRVIRTAEPQGGERAAGPVIEASAPVIEASAPVVEAAAPTIQAAVPVIEAPAPMAEAAAVIERPVSVESSAPVIETPELAETPAPVAEPAAEISSEPAEATAVIEESAPEAETIEPMAEAVLPEIEVGEAAVESPAPAEVAAEAEISPEQDEADAHAIEAALEHPNEISTPELPDELGIEGAVAQAVESEAGSVANADSNVFAREGFWGTAAESEPSLGEVPSKVILRGIKRAHATSSDSVDFEKHPEGWYSAWKTMLRLGSVLPWLARTLPALESGAQGGESFAADPGTVAAGGTTNVAQETRQDVAGLRLVQYEIRTTVQDHSMQLKRMEEQLTRVRESMDSRSSENTEVAENLRNMTKLMRMGGMGLGALLVVMIVLMIVMLAHH
ncbi:MAG: hypothetical protein ACRD3F_02290 [Acidobacteriaceae bacterium]